MEERAGERRSVGAMEMGKHPTSNIEHPTSKWENRRGACAAAPSPPSDGGEGRGEEERLLNTQPSEKIESPLSLTLSPLLRHGEREKRRARWRACSLSSIGWRRGPGRGGAF